MTSIAEIQKQAQSIFPHFHKWTYVMIFFSVVSSISKESSRIHIGFWYSDERCAKGMVGRLQELFSKILLPRLSSTETLAFSYTCMEYLSTRRRTPSPKDPSTWWDSKISGVISCFLCSGKVCPRTLWWKRRPNFTFWPEKCPNVIYFPVPTRNSSRLRLWQD